MTLPSYIKRNDPPTGNGVPSGIISSIRQTVGEENIANFVVPTTNRPSSYDITNVVKWSNQWSSSCSMDAYLQFEFKNRYVYPTYYSLKGNTKWLYTKEWYLYGINEKGNKIIIVSENSSTGSTLCGGNAQRCANSDWGTFQINNNVEPFRYLRIVIKTPSNSTYPYNNFCGFEIFGVYSSNKATLNTNMKTYCFAGYPMISHLPAYVLLRLLTTCIAI